MTPRKLKPWLIAAGVAYLLLPRDLIPDFAGRGLGFIDDLVVAAGLLWVYRKQLREFAERKARGADGPGGEPPGASGRAEATPPGGAGSDPYAVLGVPRSASQEAIRAAYRARMREYHPDKVSHLGEELQQLAHRKAQEIQRAFEALRE